MLFGRISLSVVKNDGSVEAKLPPSAAEMTSNLSVVKNDGSVEATLTPVCVL